MPPVRRPQVVSRGYRAALLALPVTLALPWWYEEARAAKAEVRELKREMAAEAGGGPNKVRRDKESEANTRKPRPEELAERQMARLREQLEVKEDAEWEVIAERILRVNQARAELGKGGPGGKPLPPIKEKAKRSGHPEQDALRSAVRDRLPDAEIKARLERAHEIQQRNEARLAQAQAELRAVLSVRQEAVMVLAGLLPP